MKCKFAAFSTEMQGRLSRVSSAFTIFQEDTKGVDFEYIYIYIVHALSQLKRIYGNSIYEIGEIQSVNSLKTEFGFSLM